MRALNSTTFLILSSLGLFSACSLVNQFDDLAEVSGPSGGMGGESAATGGEDSMGGASGGSESTGGTGGTDGPDPVAPGLVVFGADENPADSTVEDRFILALDPLTGAEYTRLQGEFISAAYEPERDIWFLLTADSMQAARFDRVDLEFEMLGQPVEVAKAVQFDYVFALGDTVSIVSRRGATSNFDIQVYNTSDLEGMSHLRDIPLPSNASTDSLWSLTSAHLNSGNSIYVAWAQCADSTLPPCNVMISRIQPENGTVTDQEVVTVTSGSSTVRSEKGSITFDIEALQPVLFVPDYTVGGVSGTLHTFTSSLVPQEQFPMREGGDQGQLLDMNPCLKSVFAKDVGQNPLVVAPLSKSPDAMGSDVAVGINGQGMVFEPYSKSLIMIQASGDTRSIALESRGTVEKPVMMKRLATWKPPQFNPTFVTVEQPIDPVCD